MLFNNKSSHLPFERFLKIVSLEDITDYRQKTGVD